MSHKPELLTYMGDLYTPQDRQKALDMRRSCFGKNTDQLYECDDKCGSWWQCLPVPDCGRFSKATVQKVYHFAIQSNSICGEDGVCRFSVVPKNVSCGSNFGLTNLLMTLYRAQEKKRIGPHVTRLVRHTDGGSDNVSEITHVLHWLLVYIGFMDEVLWFRFESGHSHTEIADRFFALLKKIFETDSSARVRQGVKDFAELEGRMREEFARISEEFFWECE